VRRHAIRLRESQLARSPALGAALVRLADDPDPQVRLQVAYSLGAWNDPRGGRTLGRLMVRDAWDPFLSAAAMSSVTRGNFAATLETVLAAGPKSPSPALIENLLSTAIGFDETSVTAALLRRIAAPEGSRPAAWQLTAMAGWLDALDQRGTLLETLEKTGHEELNASLRGLSRLFEWARDTVDDTQAPVAERIRAIRLLGRGLDHRQEDLASLARLLVPQTQREVQAAVVAALGRLRLPQVPNVLLRGWKGASPGLRDQILDVLLGRDEGIRALLEALDRREVFAAEIDAVRRERLLRHPSATLRAQAARRLDGMVDPDRQKVVGAYQPALAKVGDLGRGLRVFTKHCAVCHRVGDVGQAVGPDLAAVHEKTPEWLLQALFDPSRAVDAKYVNYLVRTRDGVVLSGVLSQESGNSITLIDNTGKPQAVLRENIEELISTGKSAMPDGFEKELGHEEVADLFTFLRSAGLPRSGQNEGTSHAGPAPKP
jgi:putative heme-binding domain-containing protein